jgi:hypothetical protein
VTMASEYPGRLSGMIRISFTNAVLRATRGGFGVELTVTSGIMDLQLRNRSRVAWSLTPVVYLTLKILRWGELASRRDVGAAHDVLLLSAVRAKQPSLAAEWVGGWSVNTSSTALL